MIPPLLAPTLVRHRGTLLAFATPAGQAEADVYYDTLDLAAGEPDDASAWSGFRPLTLPSALRPAGLALIDVETVEGEVGPVPGGSIEVVSDGTQLYLFRISTRGTLWVNRLAMVEMGTDRITKRPVREVHPAWEVRFVGTGQRDVAAGPGDSQRFIAPDGEPYVEPTIELSMVRAEGGSVAVELVPADNGTRMRWHVFAVSSSAPATVSAWSFDRDDDGMFDLSNQKVNPGTLTVEPELEFSPSLPGTPSQTAELVTGLTAQLYAKQERIAAGPATGTGARRSIRLLLAAGVKPSGSAGGSTGTMMVDFAIGADGALAPVPEAPQLGAIAPANNTLEFDGAAAVTLADPGQALALSGPFTLEAWTYPTAPIGSPTSTVIGGVASSAAEAPPTLTLTPGGGFAVGFGNGSAEIACATTETALKTHAWQHLCASFDGTSISLYLNGEAVASTVTGTIGPPQGEPITSIGGDGEAGFVGTIDEVRVWNVNRSVAEVRATMLTEIADPPASLVGYWTFDLVEVDDSVTPPIRLTPDESTYGNDGTLAGARQIPSTAPVAPATAATEYTTGGLTTTAGIATFARPATTPALLDGADGLVHLYFGDSGGELCAAQYDTTIARAAFAVPWVAGTQQGHLTFVARRAGSATNRSAIAVSKTDADTCSLALADGGTRTESWEGVPSELIALLTVLSGQAYSRPTDPGLASGSAIFYDYAGIYYQVRVPVGPGQLVVADIDDRLRLGSVELKADGGAATGTLAIELTRPGWTGTVTQTWTSVPTDVTALLAVLSGLSGGYDYSTVGLSALPAYSLAAEGETFAIAFDPGQVSSAGISVADATALAGSFAKVTISVARKGGSALAATWDQVPRRESQVAAILEGGDPSYDYGTNASGDYAEVSALLVALGGDLDATVGNQAATELARPQLVSSQYRALATGAAGAIATFSATATISQGVKASPIPGDLSSGSQLFAAIGDGGPTNGVPATVQPVQEAPMTQAGTAGGWIAQEARYGLQLEGSAAVSVDVAQPAGDELAMQGDMAIEAWVNAGEPAGANPRILHCHRQLDPNDPLTESEYGIGLCESHYLQLVEGTAVEASAIEAALSPAAYSVQLWISPNLATLGQTSGTIWSLTAGGQLGVRLTIGPDGTLTLALPGGASLTSSGKLESEEWRQVSVVRNQAAVSLYLDGELDTAIANAPIEASAPDTLSIGGNTGAYALEMKANDLRVWNRPLSDAEIAAGAGEPASPDLPGLTILWPLAEGQGTTAVNRATATFPDYEGSIAVKPNSRPLWLSPGVYFGFFANRLGLGRESAGGVAAAGKWTHLAASYRSGNGLRLGGTDYADAGNDASLDLGAEISIEAWAMPLAAAASGQSLVSKWGTSEEEQSYELGLDSSLCPYLQIWGSDGSLYAAKAGDPLQVGAAAHLVGTFAVAPIAPAAGATEASVSVTISLYCDGQLIAGGDTEEVKHGVSVNLSSTSLNFGRNRPEAADPKTGSEQSCFTGIIAGVSLWSRALSAAEIGGGGLSLASFLDTTGLVSAWSFDELRGNVANDMNDVNDAVLSSNGLWCRFSPTAELALYANGVPVATQPLAVSALGPYGQDRLLIGACPDGGGVPRDGLVGQLCELRVWSAQRTQEQIEDLMHQALSGAEAGLAGYWPLDDGSGAVAADASGHGNPGELIPAASPPTWAPSSAPLATEPPVARNVLGGMATGLTAQIEGAPAAAEYGDSERDAYGRMAGVMKRALAYVSDGVVVNADGFRVGELDQQFIGQVQTEPTLVGFIEGAPPLPSENLTRPAWTSPIGISYYAGTSAVTLTENEEAVRLISSADQRGGDLLVDARAGLLLSAKVATDVPPLWFQGSELRSHAALRFKTTFSAETEDAASMSEGSLLSTSVALGANGSWEAPDAILNPAVGRRWLPDNTGLALVRSLVADLYALRLKGTGTVVSLLTVPNFDIPEDVNFIEFPLNPTYVKNGTLDGKVGAVDDPDYPDADVDRGSYFKPLEAYALLRRVERQTAALEALYAQFDAGARGRAGEAGIESEEEADPWYDWGAESARRDIANTYVWTAGGGLYKEQEQFTATRSESVSGQYHLNIQGGIHLDGEFAFLVGSYAELDALGGGHINVAVTKRRSDSAAFGIDVNVAGDRYLHAFDGQTPDPEPTPGKVEAYRFMSAYLAPARENSEAFFAKVVDPNWLANSNEDYAVALREAKTGTNPAWRLLHRLTYVRRIPPTFDQDPVRTPAPELTPPPDIAGNAELIQLVQLALPANDRLDPSPAVLGTAVAAVLETSLASAIPWWPAFLESAKAAGSPAASALRRLRHDLLAYMIALYASANAEPTLELPV